ncbi:ACT domain-containing protein [Halovivax cerinus]|uniref:ACT domain-containing protein n=1 Tax=Halovivax cerinus TaxID=1487865 RepID=A0ABD5NL68_9EURY|nr:ACT domain-containing protein [Halovivax cerinus]
MSDANADESSQPSPTGASERTAYTLRLELEDEPGRLHHALGPITEHGGNLRSIHHERGNRTPRGTIPVEIVMSCSPAQFDALVESLEAADVTVIEAGSRRFERTVNVVLVGHLVDTDLSDTLSRIEAFEYASVVDVSLAAPEGTEGVSSTRVQLAVDDGNVEPAIDAIRSVADEKDIAVVEPLHEGDR